MSKMAPQQENGPPLLEPVASEVQIRNVPAGLSRIELAGITQYHSGEFSATALADAAASNDHRIRTTNDVMSDLNQFLVPYEAPPFAPAPGPGTVFAAAGYLMEITVASRVFQHLASELGLLEKLWPFAQKILTAAGPAFRISKVPSSLAEEIAKDAKLVVQEFRQEVRGIPGSRKLRNAFNAFKDAVIRNL